MWSTVYVSGPELLKFNVKPQILSAVVRLPLILDDLILEKSLNLGVFCTVYNMSSTLMSYLISAGVHILGQLNENLPHHIDNWSSTTVRFTRIFFIRAIKFCYRLPHMVISNIFNFGIF